MATTKRRPNNLIYLHRDRGYRFTDLDPTMIEVRSIINQSDISIGEIIERVLDATNGSVHIGYSTIANWLNGKTKRPQNFTLTWVLYALGYERRLVKIRD